MMTGTREYCAAKRPQNILSPAPTVTSASICRFRSSLVIHPSTRRSYFDFSPYANVGISFDNSSPSFPCPLMQHNSVRSDGDRDAESNSSIAFRLLHR